MAHGLEARVPFLDHRLVEFAATIPANVKFADGELKRLLRVAFADRLPREIRERKDKMGFPVPLQVWLGRKGPARDLVSDILTSSAARTRPYLSRPIDVDSLIDGKNVYSRNLWALLSLELWHRQFVD
jgi:asparagine synthase (glutamine-hydrolysing)